MRAFNGAMRWEDQVRFFLRTGRYSGVSVRIVGGLVFLVLVGVLWFWVAVLVGAVLMGAVLIVAAAYASAL